MKKLIFTIAIGLVGMTAHAQTSSKSILIDGVDVKDFIIILKYFWKRKIKSSGKEINIKCIRNLEATSKYLMHEFYKLGNDTLALNCSNI